MADGSDAYLICLLKSFYVFFVFNTCYDVKLDAKF